MRGCVRTDDCETLIDRSQPMELRHAPEARRSIASLADDQHVVRSGLRRTACSAARVKPRDRKSTRLNSSHVAISYAVFCLKKKINSLSLLSLIQQNKTH